MLSEVATVATGVIVAAEKTRNGGKPATADDTGPATETDTLTSIINFVIAYPWIPIGIVVLVLINIGWRKLVMKKNLAGQPFPPLGFTVKRVLRVALVEDKTPVFNRPAVVAQRLSWLTWRRYWFVNACLFVLVAFGLTDRLPANVDLAATVLAGLMILHGVGHVRRVFQIRHRILMQMFEVAAAECRYLKGAELNPWGYIQIKKWRDLYSPDTTTIMFPPRYRSEDQNNREAFETNFNGTVSDAHMWTYTWESANNRVIAEPVPYITDNAPYPFPDKHPWNEFPLGLGAGGEEVVLNIATYPHCLLAGSTGSGKALAIRERIPTPSGWTTMGELKPGDQVFDERGRPCTVTWVSEVNNQPDLFEVVFSDGSTIKADADHLWFTETIRGEADGCFPHTADRLPDDGETLLKALSESLKGEDEVTLREIADWLGTTESALWLREVADRLGPVGEVQGILEVHFSTRTAVNSTQGYNSHASGLLNASATGIEVHRPPTFMHCITPWTRTYNARALVEGLLRLYRKPEQYRVESFTYGSVKTTREILDTLHSADGQARHTVPVTQPLQLPNANLPVDPYVLGLNLGTAMSGQVTPEREHPYPLSPRIAESDADSVVGLIPDMYLRGSVSQRLAILAGVLDAYRVPLNQRTVHIDVAEEAARKVSELAVSLGYQVRLTQASAKILQGTETSRCRMELTRPPSRSSSSPGNDIEWNGHPVGRFSRSIIDIRPIEPVPARCIAVDSPSRMFLAGEAMIPTHNSVTQRSMLLHALQQPDMRVLLIDPKRVELSAYRDHPHVMKIATELEESTQLLEQAEAEMQARYTRMEKEGVNFFKQMADPPPAILIMVDEAFALLSPENIKSDEGKERDEMHARCTVLLGSIARLGRAAGVHLILATQRPDAKVIPGETRALALDTPLLTVHGWTTVGEVERHDIVFDERGQATRVIGTTEVMYDHPCYQIGFSDGERIVADAGHLWALEVEMGAYNCQFVGKTEDVFDLLTFGATVSVPSVGATSDGPVAAMAARQVMTVTPVESVPVKCIAVDSPSRLFLAGKNLVPTHNSNLDARIAQGRMDTTPSLMTLDSDAATRLPPIKGRAVYRAGNETTEFQAYFLPPEYLGQVLEMSAAIATGLVSPDDLLDTGDESGGSKRKLSLPVPRSLAQKFAQWSAKRKAAVEENERQARKFAGEKKRKKEQRRDHNSLPEPSQETAVPASSLEQAEPVYIPVPHTQQPPKPVIPEPPLTSIEDDLLDDVDGFEIEDAPWMPETEQPQSPGATAFGISAPASGKQAQPQQETSGETGERTRGRGVVPPPPPPQE